MINLIPPSLRYFDHVFEELGVRSRPPAKTLSKSNVCWPVVVILVQRTLFDANHICSSLCSAVRFGSMLESFFRTLFVTNKKSSCILQRSIIFRSCEFLSHTIVFRRYGFPLATKCLSPSLVTGKQSVAGCTAWRESGWPG